MASNAWIKAQLKQAKESIHRKDFKDAIERCKRITESDPDNYYAHVYLGVSYTQLSEHLDLSREMYLKAISIDPENVLGWQGLVRSYDKLCEKDKWFRMGNWQNDERLNAYFKLMRLEKDVATKLSYLERAKDIHLDESHTFPFLNELSKFVLENEDAEDDFIRRVCQLLFNLASQLREIPPELAECYRRVLVNYINDKKADKRNNAYFEKFKKLMEYLKANGELIIVLERSVDMCEYFPKDTFLICMICEVYCEICLKDEGHLIESVEAKIGEIVSIANSVFSNKSPSKYVVSLFKGVFLYNRKLYVEAADIFRPLINPIKCGIRIVWQARYFMVQCCYKLCRYVKAFKTARDCRRFGYQLPDDIRRKLKVIAIDCSSECEVKNILGECSRVCSANLEKDSVDREMYLKCLFKSNVALERFDLASDNLNSLREVLSGNEKELLLLECRLLEKRGDILDAADQIRNSLSIYPGDYDLKIWLGKLCWCEGKFEDARKIFVKCLKKNPDYYVPYYFIGLYFKEVAKDNLMAKKALSHGFLRTRENEKLGIAYCDVLLELGEMDTYVATLKVANSAAQNIKWTNFRLGFYYLSIRIIDSALYHLHRAAIADENDFYVCFALADIDQDQGRFVAAEWYYKRCLLMRPDDPHVINKYGELKWKQGKLRESSHDFYKLTQVHPDFLPSVKNYASIIAVIGLTYLKNWQFESCASVCQTAIDAITRALKNADNDVVLWTHLGELLLLCTHLPDSIRVKVHSFVLGCAKSNDSALYNDKNAPSRTAIELLHCCVIIYMKLAEVTERPQMRVFHLRKLATSLYYLSIKEKDKDKRVDFTQKALQCVEICAKMNNTNWRNWNLYGILAGTDLVYDYSMAKYYFNCALLAKGKQEVPAIWSNLAVLNLIFDKEDEATVAIERAQTESPAYSRAWALQAYLAECNGEESLELSFHAVTLGLNQIGVKLFTRSVWRFIHQFSTRDPDKVENLIVHRQNGFCLALTSLIKYIIRYDKDAYARNLLGEMLRYTGLLEPAAHSFLGALQVANTRGDTNIILSNLARVLVRLGRYKEAIDVYKELTVGGLPELLSMAFCFQKLKSYWNVEYLYDFALERLKRACQVPEIAKVAFVRKDIVKTLQVIYLYETKGKRNKRFVIPAERVSRLPTEIKFMYALYKLQTSNSTKLDITPMTNFKEKKIRFEILMRPELSSIMARIYFTKCSKDGRSDIGVRYIRSMIQHADYAGNVNLINCFLEVVLHSRYNNVLNGVERLAASDFVDWLRSSCTPRNRAHDVAQSYFYCALLFVMDENAPEYRKSLLKCKHIYPGFEPAVFFKMLKKQPDDLLDQVDYLKKIFSSP